MLLLMKFDDVLFVWATKLEKHIPYMHILITIPVHPVYMTTKRIKKAKNLKFLITTSVGSDHIDLNTHAENVVIIDEVSGTI